MTVAEKVIIVNIMVLMMVMMMHARDAKNDVKDGWRPLSYKWIGMGLGNGYG